MDETNKPRESFLELTKGKESRTKKRDTVLALLKDKPALREMGKAEKVLEPITIFCRWADQFPWPYEVPTHV